MEETVSILSLRRVIKIISLFKIGKFYDLAIVVVGDFSILRVLKVLSKYNIKVVGINIR
ncbi:hypothetical protein [Candidatus Purcelliella pentastirinorum]|uniref:hypothetical protein n=1 Tax=Candidatus Purcelliella pentastirinorum TaxID=472834 RepID=UPI00236894D4|nr:hypothetical protein [Candidatus Purcelliella pentastirinorum]WDI78767.1 hypothetical protein ONB68_01270 [Candidatus Purcelliella pentastirinorum]